MRTRTRHAAAAAGFAVLVAGCGTVSGSDATASPTTVTSAFVGPWGEPDPPAPSLTIEGDGTFSGNDGCNSLTGRGSVVDRAFVFGEMASTRKACVDVDAWLAQAHHATVDGDTLTVLSADETVLGALERP
ncbi:META domain-containing protein [Cellulomonas sp. ACRRI]|uniref:META domain-containing protein n=1 Tax=Cellulomonas sp. ACRRI TaxID=2918188 RepID=UPI001EF36B35|nr:META domain-containing protein [Cellulomonas sp. ACRRI]MCG7286157.1 META domain-containing protein [Cellulomonas sp. ACRRI]